MSGKTAKAKRKLLKEKQKAFLHIMEQRNEQQPQAQLGIQVINFLENFIQLYVTLTGEKPASITLTDVMYNAYIQESQRHAEILGLNPGFKSDPMFNGVKLEKKSPLVVPEGTKTAPAVKEATSSTIETSSN